MFMYLSSVFEWLSFSWYVDRTSLYILCLIKTLKHILIEETYSYIHISIVSLMYASFDICFFF